MGRIRDVMCPLRAVHPLSLSPLAPWFISGYSFPPKALGGKESSPRKIRTNVRASLFLLITQSAWHHLHGNFPHVQAFFQNAASVSWSKFNSSAITLPVNHVFESAKSLTFSAFSWVPPHGLLTVHHLRHLLTYSETSCGSQNSLLWPLLLFSAEFLTCRLQIAFTSWKLHYFHQIILMNLCNMKCRSLVFSDASTKLTFSSRKYCFFKVKSFYNICQGCVYTR